MGTYQLGVDLGTTYTGAAVRHDGVSEIVTLGTQSATMPTVVVAAPDGTLLVGEAAERRAMELPERTSRQFKRRLGDTTPILLGGTPYSPQALLGAVLADVVSRVTAERGEAPERVCISHPANWGPYKRELVRQIAELAGLDASAVVTLAEPAAAALHYASQAHLAPGSTVAVYDLGGGTFDAAVVRIDVGGAELLGDPTGIEHLGGIDFDAIVFDHVVRQLGPRLDSLLDGGDDDAPLLARLRAECTRAKEALSTDADTVVGVALPDGYAEVRLTRGEFEELLRPALVPTAESLRRAVGSAGLVPADLAGVLLVGGSSRIPLVSEVVSAELGRPVLLDTHPKHAVALGAAAHVAGVEVGEVVEVIGGEVPLGAGGPRPWWRAPALAAVVVLLATVGLLVGLVLTDDDEPQLIEAAADEGTTTTDADDEDGDGTTTTSTTATTLPGETTTSVLQLPGGGTSIVFGPSGGGGGGAAAGGGGGGGSATTAATTPGEAPTTAPTAPPVTFTTPSAVRNALVSGGEIVEFFPDSISKTVRINVSWQVPADTGGGLSSYRIVGTPLFEGTSQFGAQIVADVPANQTSRELDVTITQDSGQGLGAGGFVRWEVYAINGAGTAGPVTRPNFVVPNITNMSRFHHFRVIWSLGGSVISSVSGSCGTEVVCSQSPTSGNRGNGQSVTAIVDND